MSFERAVIVGAGEERYLDELGRLAATLGVEVVGRLEQNRRDGSGYLGRGKRLELAELVSEAGASIVITDDELTASQARVLEQGCGAEVVDRTELIIRIFELHARDAASRLQVELADLEYRLPRVKGRNPALSRLGGGGVTTRGPGEQQLEYDRRAIRRRMDVIHRKLEQEKNARAVRGARLLEEGPPTVALVGYTNAGKTTILNSLSGEARSTANRLFETLETTARTVPGKFNGGSRPDFVVVDTVGFIRKLPTQLVHSFAGTLEAARDADIRVLCADASSPTLQQEIETVRHTLSDMAEDFDVDLEDGPDGFLEDPRNILCLNKIDLLPEEKLADLRLDYPEAVEISALQNASPLLEAIYESIATDMERVEVLIPHSEYGAAAQLYGKAEIHDSRNTVDGLRLDVTLPKSTSRKYAHYRLS